MSNKITFWQLIEGNKIEIPVIQRDYAQGREEDKVNSIRKEFIKDLISIFEKTEKALHIGFVYGKIEGKDKHIERERNKRAIENILNAVEGYAQQLDMRITTDITPLSNARLDAINLPNFIPLDGQQRLTTLFLLHWYLIVFSDNRDLESHLKTLSHFSYKTRKSSLEFCNAISQLDYIKGLKGIKGLLSEFIQNQKWFRKIWMRDSTVKGMLVMLDEIHGQLINIPNKVNILNQLLLKEIAPISFDFLDLNELNQTDELYVKMNARGKQLSEFEHFKAWLQHYVSIRKINVKDGTEHKIALSDLIEEKEWKLKLDRAWLDLFWKNKEPGVYFIDDVIYHAFKQIALFAFIACKGKSVDCLLYTSPSPRDGLLSRMPSSA